MKKIVASILMVVMLLGSMCMPAAAEFNSDTRNSVVVVSTCLELDAGILEFGWGSGFFVGETSEDPSYLITNYHVISDFMDYGQGQLITVETDDGEEYTGRAKIRVYYSSSDYEEAYVVGSDEIKDIAVLKLAGATSKRNAIPLQEPTDDMVGSTVHAIGYPGLADNIFADATSTWSATDSTVTSGSISRLFLQAGTGVSEIQIDCDIKSGNSGGPLVNEDGAAVGINTSSVTDVDTNASVNYAISISEVIPLLKQYSVPYTTLDTEAATTGEEGSAVDSAAEGSAAESSAAEADTDEEEEDDSFPVIPVVIAVVVLFVIAGVVVVVVVVSSKNKKAAQQREAEQRMAEQRMAEQRMAEQRMAEQRMAEQQRMQQQAAAAVKQGYVRSMAEQHRGARVAVNGQIMLGRSRECALVFQDGTPGVSGQHASLSYDPATGEFILMDLQSRYGTYLRNGQKLTPNLAYRLHNGDQFYFGEKQNMLQVEVN